MFSLTSAAFSNNHSRSIHAGNAPSVAFISCSACFGDALWCLKRFFHSAAISKVITKRICSMKEKDKKKHPVPPAESHSQPSAITVSGFSSALTWIRYPDLNADTLRLSLLPLRLKKTYYHLVNFSFLPSAVKTLSHPQIAYLLTHTHTHT